MNNKLFKEFDAVSSKQWKQKIQFDLKGADYNDALNFKTAEGIDIKPFYHADDFDVFPNVSKTKATQWKIRQSVFVADVEKANLKVIRSIKRGAESIRFIVPDNNISIQSLIKNIDVDTVCFYFELQFLSENFIEHIKRQIPKAKIYIDVIGHLAETGNHFNGGNSDFKTFTSIVNKTKLLSINGVLYQNAGANMVQQIAYSIAHANEYLNILEKNNVSLQAFTIVFNVSVGGNYFFEIAKLKALRILWETLAIEYNANPDCYIVATPTKRNKTLYDCNTNMLRTTTECMSAILGGANVIENLPHNAIYRKSNELGERIARNQLLILKHEGHFNKVDNPSDGSYYVESVTNQLSEKALNLFKKIEHDKGFLSLLKAGTIQRKIKESALKEQQQFDKGEEVLLGGNKYVNIDAKIKAALELYPFVKRNPRKTLIEPIIEKRLSEYLEQNQLKKEN